MENSLPDDELIAVVLENVATSEQERDFEKKLATDDSFQRRVMMQSRVHALLGVDLENELAEERSVRDIMAAVEKADADHFVQGVESRLVRKRGARWAVAAAILMSLVATVFFVTRPSDEPSMAATLTRAHGVVWAGDSRQPQSEFATGSVVKIDHGLVELDLDGRGRLIVEGPAHLEFPEQARAVLHTGRVVMRATKKGHGYRIDTPHGSIVDLGTEFGISIGQDGEVETHVIDGSVEAIPKHGESVILKRDSAIRLEDKGSTSMSADAGQFYTSLPPEHSSKPKHLHWSFDEGEGSLARGTGALAEGVRNHVALVLHAERPGKSPQWISGVIDSALSFDGLGSYAESGFPGIGGGDPRTLCLWLKVPKEFSTRQGFGIISWGKFRRPGEVWQLSVNPLEEDGPIGRLRLGLHGAEIVGSTDLRDGEWHHIAVVMYGGSKPNIGTHVIFYIDGKPEQLSRRALKEVRTEIKDADHGVWVGRNVAPHVQGQKHMHGEFFRGEVDELYIFDAALTQDELLEVMRAGN